MIGPVRPPCDDVVVQGAAVPGTDRAKPWVLAATIVASSMAFIDGTVINVALPSMQAGLGAGVSQAQWIVNAYMLMLGALILVGGAAGDQFGRRRICMLGISVFTAASVACGLAPNTAVLIAARVLQGLGGALLVPSSLAIISAAFPEQERGRAIGTWAGASALTTALGPVLGGWLIDNWSWRAVFFINLPVGLIALVLAARWIPESRDESASGVDWKGGALAVSGLGMLAYGLTDASRSGWAHATVLCCVAGAVLLLSLLLWWETRAPAPMMPLSLFRSGSFSGANAVTLLLYFSLTAVLFFVPFDLIDIQGYSATQAGAAFLPFSVIMTALSRWSGGLVQHYGARVPLIAGPIITTIGLVLLAVPTIGGSYWSTFFPAIAVMGLGMAISVAPLTTTVMRAAGDRHAGAASGINNAIARIAGLLAVALLGTIAVGVFRVTLDKQLELLHLSAQAMQSLDGQVQRLAEAQVPRQFDRDTRHALELVLKQSFVFSFRVTTLIAAAAAFLGAIIAWLTIDRSRRPAL
jgi:EmrB/QacA subfamily drug resistance transporter